MEGEQALREGDAAAVQRDIFVDVAIGQDDVLATVAIVVHERKAEGCELQRGLKETGLIRHVAEVSLAIGQELRQALACVIADEDRLTAAVCRIGGVDSHPGARLALAA